MSYGINYFRNLKCTVTRSNHKGNDFLNEQRVLGGFIYQLISLKAYLRILSMIESELGTLAPQTQIEENVRMAEFRGDRMSGWCRDGVGMVLR